MHENWSRNEKSRLLQIIQLVYYIYIKQISLLASLHMHRSACGRDIWRNFQGNVNLKSSVIKFYSIIFWHLPLVRERKCNFPLLTINTTQCMRHDTEIDINCMSHMTLCIKISLDSAITFYVSRKNIFSHIWHT